MKFLHTSYCTFHMDSYFCNSFLFAKHPGLKIEFESEEREANSKKLVYCLKDLQYQTPYLP